MIIKLSGILFPLKSDILTQFICHEVLGGDATDAGFFMAEK